MKHGMILIFLFPLIIHAHISEVIRSYQEKKDLNKLSGQIALMATTLALAETGN